MRVRGLQDCAGLDFTLNVGEEKELPLGIAESLILGGLAEEIVPTDADGNIVIDARDGVNEDEASAAGKVLKQYEREQKERAQQNAVDVEGEAEASTRKPTSGKKSKSANAS